MSKVYLTKSYPNLCPADEESLEIIKKLKTGKLYCTDIKEVRNPKFHKKYMALLNYGFDNQYEGNEVIYDNFDSFRKEVAMKSGFYTVHKTTKGQLLYFPDSISFAKMDETKFNKLFDRSIDVILKHFLAPETEKEVIEQVLSFLN